MVVGADHSRPVWAEPWASYPTLMQAVLQQWGKRHAVPTCANVRPICIDVQPTWGLVGRHGLPFIKCFFLHSAQGNGLFLKTRIIHHAYLDRWIW